MLICGLLIVCFVAGTADKLWKSPARTLAAALASAGAQTTIAQTSLITFNSRGLSIDSTSTGYPIGGNPIGTAAIYINDGKGLYFAITANLVGQPAVWEYNGTAWKQL